MHENKPLEIERKFLIKKYPGKLEENQKKDIIQGYISIEDGGKEVRLRNCNKTYSLTVKEGSGLVRLEHEIRLTLEQFNTLWPATKGKRIHKTRHITPSNIEIDVYHGSLNGLIIAEVEFSSESASKSFICPDWFAEEITYDSTFKNQNLAVNGLGKLSL